MIRKKKKATTTNGLNKTKTNVHIFHGRTKPFFSKKKNDTAQFLTN